MTRAADDRESRSAPGPAWLVRLQTRALFHPRGAAGHAYWWAVRPFHDLVFGSMLRNIARTAEQLTPPSANAGNPTSKSDQAQPIHP